MKCLEVPRSRLQWTETEDEKEARGRMRKRPGVSVPKRQLQPGRMRSLVERTERGERGVHKEDQLDQ